MSVKDQTQEVMQQEALLTDRADLLGLLELRFGAIPPEVRTAIEQIDKLESLERLILVAANLATWEQFLAELEVNNASFRIVGEYYRPI